MASNIDNSSCAGRGRQCGGLPARPEEVFPLRICAAGFVVGSLLIASTYLVLDGKRRAQATERANAEVAEHVASARAHLGRQDWEPATAELQQAVATQDATNLAEAQELLTQARQQRAEAVWVAVAAELGQRSVWKSFWLLDSYLSDPDALQKDRAADLRAELELATSDARALALLRQLPDEALAKFVSDGKLAILDGVHHPVARSLLTERMQSHLRQELERRAELRRQEEATRLAEQRRREDERAKRVARIRATPIFRELQEFVARTRRTHPNSGPSPDELRVRQYVIRELKITDPVLESQLFEEPGLRPETRQQVEVQISQMRASVKERFRGPAYREFDQADREAFDHAVDRELDQLLREVGHE